MIKPQTGHYMILGKISKDLLEELKQKKNKDKDLVYITNKPRYDSDCKEVNPQDDDGWISFDVLRAKDYKQEGKLFDDIEQVKNYQLGLLFDLKLTDGSENKAFFIVDKEQLLKDLLLNSLRLIKVPNYSVN